jgi:hypothetical protein
VHEQLGRLALQARREGVSFQAFWLRAVRPGISPLITTMNTPTPPEYAVVWPHDTAERRLAQQATNESIDVWRRAYLREPPTPAEEALMRLFGLMVGDQENGSRNGTALTSIAA